jgi:phosphopantothenate-cysteine ligase
MKILITSGGTKVPIDKVRDITNMSHGTFGSRIAHVALAEEHEVCFLCAKGSRTPFRNDFDFYNDNQAIHKVMEYFLFCEEYQEKYSETEFRNYDDYERSLGLLLDWKPDVVILAAAVSDYGVANYVNGKIRTQDNLQISLEPLPKIIATVKERLPNCFLVGFKLLVYASETELIEEASKSIINNRCDLVVANDLASLQANNHRLFLVRPDQVPVSFCKNDALEDPYYLAGKVVEAATER